MPSTSWCSFTSVLFENGKAETVTPKPSALANRLLALMTVIEIRPYRCGWKAFESPGAEPVFPRKDQGIDYALQRACFRLGHIQILDSTGNVERVISFDDMNRKL